MIRNIGEEESGAGGRGADSEGGAAETRSAQPSAGERGPGDVADRDAGLAVDGAADQDGSDDDISGDDMAESDVAPDDIASSDGSDDETAGLAAVGLDPADGPRARSASASDRAETSAPQPPKAKDAEELKGAVEAILFSVSEPIGIRALSDLVGVGVHEVRSAVEELRYEYVQSQRAFRLEEIAGGVQLLTHRRFDPWLVRLRQKEKQGRLSAAALETLSVVAYKQPITKADLEAIRGVGCSQILKTLMDRGLLQVVGRDEGLGKPLLYGTTKRFLESFGLQSVRDLPQPEEGSPEEGGGAVRGGASQAR